MKFYKINAKFEQIKEEPSVEELFSDDTFDVASKRKKIFESKFNKNNNKTYIFISPSSNGEVEGGIITLEKHVEKGIIYDIAKECGLNIDIDSLKIEECNSHTFGELYGEAQSSRYVPKIKELLAYFPTLEEVFDTRLSGIFQYSSWYNEKIVKCKDRKELEENAEKLLWTPSLINEFDRVYKKTSMDRAYGIPVQYLFCGNDFEKRQEAVELLISALYQNGRISQKRYADIGVSSIGNRDTFSLDALFDTYKGGVLIFRFKADARRNIGDADIAFETINEICRCICKYKNEVQVILCFPLSCEREKEMFFEQLNGVSFVALDEGYVNSEDAYKYLLVKAKELGYESFEGLKEKVEEDKPYRSLELDSIFDNWATGFLKNVVYPQYSNVLSIEKEELVSSPKGNAYDRLQKMIGLRSAKKIIENALNYYKTQKLMESKNIKTEKPSMHMVFTGNPGTAKTTVARLFAEIMRDNKVLSRGHMVEVGRGDLVGKYTGWTAPTIQKKFREAKGGVLFIDEAYSLVDDRDGSFGDEAINTIVQEMENNRKDVVVIFAGYPDEMQRFLDKNPGLSSRIAFHVSFEDYSVDELCEITTLMANDKNITLGEGVKEKIYDIYKNVSNNTSFGNGRFVRNLIEKASMNQATRLMNGEIDDITESNLLTLCAEDFEYERNVNVKNTKIGF